MSAPFAPQFSQASSDPRLIGVMGIAYAKACKMLHDKGQPALVQDDSPTGSDAASGSASTNVGP